MIYIYIQIDVTLNRIMVGSEHWESASCDPEEFRLPLPRYLLDLITKTLQVLVVDYERKGPAADMCATRF